MYVMQNLMIQIKFYFLHFLGSFWWHFFFFKSHLLITHNYDKTKFLKKLT